MSEWGSNLLLSHANYLLICTAATIALLMLLILKARLHPAIAILVSSIVLGAATGMPLGKIPASIATGVGALLSHVALVLGLGAVLGHLLASSGGAGAIGESLIRRFGPRGLPFAMMLMGILVGFPVFFEVGLVLLMPIVVSVGRRSGKAPILAGIPTLAGLSIVHGLIPPHPAAMMAVVQYHADVAKTILMGLAVGLPAAVFAGPLYAMLYERFSKVFLSSAFAFATSPTRAKTSRFETLSGELEPSPQPLSESRRGLVPVSVFVLLLPVALIFAGSWADLFVAPNGPVGQFNAALHLIGDPPIALLIAVLVAEIALGHICGWGRSESLKLIRESFAPIAGVLMILAAAGGLSRVLNDSGAAQATVQLAMSVHLSPLLLAWLLAATIRVSIGSATVAMAVTTGILAPVAASMGTVGGFGPELLVLSTGAGSLFFSHVSDPGFWMIKEFFGLELSETLATWSILETILSVTGLLGTLTLAAFLRR